MLNGNIYCLRKADQFFRSRNSPIVAPCTNPRIVDICSSRPLRPGNASLPVDAIEVLSKCVTRLSTLPARNHKPKQFGFIVPFCVDAQGHIEVGSNLVEFLLD